MEFNVAAGIFHPFATMVPTRIQDVNVLFNDTLNTFYLWLCGIKHVVGLNDHSNSKRGNMLLPLHRLLFLISSKGSFICTIPQIG